MSDPRPRTRRRLGVSVAAAFALACVAAPAASALPPTWDPVFGAPLSISNDDDNTTAGGGEVPVTFGTFSFPFRGATFTGATQLTVSSNGLLFLGTNNNTDNGPTGPKLIAMTTPVIAPFWDDMNALDGPPDLGSHFFKTVDDNADTVLDRLVVTFAANDFGGCLLAYPACGGTEQVQLFRDGRILFGYDSVFANPGGANQPVLVGLSGGGLLPAADPGSIDYSASAFPITASSGTVYEVFASSPRRFDLNGRNLLFTPVGTGFTVAQLGTDVAVTSTLPATSATGANTTFASTVSNTGAASATGVVLRSHVPAGAKVLSATADHGGTCVIATSVRCTLGTIAPAALAHVNIVLRPTDPDTLSATAVVTPAEGGDPSRNNRSTASTAVSGDRTAQAGDAVLKAPVTKLTVRNERLASIIRHGLRASLRCDVACSIYAQVTVDSATARRFGILSGPVISTKGADRSTAGTSSLALTIDPDAAARLKRARSFKVTVLTEATSEDGVVRTVRKKITIRR
jgi:uncharacterized repeat protein (TIGR01451 family)